MERRIQDYIPYYIGQDVLIYHSDSEPISATLEGYDGASEMVICERVRYKPEQIKLQLRPLSDMTEIEANEVWMELGLNPEYEESMKRDGNYSATKLRYLQEYFYRKPIFPGHYERFDFNQNTVLINKLIKQGFDVFSLNELVLNKTTTLPTHDRDKLMEELRKSEIY